MLFFFLVNGFTTVVYHAKLLIFADCLKIFMYINNIQDMVLLQLKFNRLVCWNEYLDLTLNIKNVKKYLFILNKKRIIINYYINSYFTPSVENFDFGFRFNPTLNPRLHVKNVYCNALKTIDFILMVSCEFKLQY